MDFRNVNFSIKKSQIHTHMLGLSQKLTKFDIAWKDKCCIGFWVWFPKNGCERAFVYRLPQRYRVARLKLCKNYSKKPKIGGNRRKHENSGNIVCLPSLSLPPGCVGGERGMGLKFGGKGKPFRLKISSEKLHQIGALCSFFRAETYLTQL